MAKQNHKPSAPKQSALSALDEKALDVFRRTGGTMHLFESLTAEERNELAEIHDATVDKPEDLKGLINDFHASHAERMAEQKAADDIQPEAIESDVAGTGEAIQIPGHAFDADGHPLPPIRRVTEGNES